MSGERWRDVRLGEVKIEHENRPDGSIVLRSLVPLGEYPANAASLFRHWAAAAPDRTFLAERDADGGWRRLTFGEAGRLVEAIGQALLDHGLSDARPLAILSGNSIEHALLTYAGMAVGVPVVPISVAYSLLREDHLKLRRIIDLVGPGLVFADDGEQYGRALSDLDLGGIEVVTSRAVPPGLGATDFARLTATEPTAGVEAAYEAVDASRTAKILFTSGSTGEPKGVRTTHGMLAANQQIGRAHV